MRLHSRQHGTQKQTAILGLMLLMMIAALAPTADRGSWWRAGPVCSSDQSCIGGARWKFVYADGDRRKFRPGVGRILGLIAAGHHVRVVDEADCDCLRRDD